MERTQAFQVLAGLAQADMLADDFSDVYPVSDLTDKFNRNLASRHADPRSSRALRSSTHKRERNLLKYMDKTTVQANKRVPNLSTNRIQAVSPAAN